MQRLFSMFPRGGPGVGLLLLRVSVAATFVLIVANRADMSSMHPLSLGALVIALGLTAGVLTPYLSYLVCIYGLVNLLTGGPHLQELVSASLIVNAGALALLGPGAYSVDARLFGHRVVVVPPRRDPDQF